LRRQKRLITYANIKTGWITGLDHVVVSPSAAAPLNPHADKPNAALKRPGQYWSQQGDEALLGLETFQRNNRWHLLFPHNRNLDPAKN
jgi:hypothetical protein